MRNKRKIKVYFYGGHIKVYSVAIANYLKTSIFWICLGLNIILYNIKLIYYLVIDIRVAKKFVHIWYFKWKIS